MQPFEQKNFFSNLNLSRLDRSFDHIIPPLIQLISNSPLPQRKRNPFFLSLPRFDKFNETILLHIQSHWRRNFQLSPRLHFVSHLQIPFCGFFRRPLFFLFLFFFFFFFTADVEKENHRPPRIKIMAHLAVTFAILFEPMRLALSYQSMGNNVRRAMLLIWIYPVRVKTCNIRLIKNIGQRRKVIAANIKLSERSS